MEKTSGSKTCECVIGLGNPLKEEPTKTGWVCPKCLNSNSPYVDICPFCLVPLNKRKKMKVPFYIFKMIGKSNVL